MKKEDAAVKAKQAFLHNPFDLRIEEVELRELKQSEILVKVYACGICGSDVECMEGKTKEGRYDIQPYVPGHEFAGKVIDVGGDVHGIKAGDKVTSECVVACGICKNCKDGRMPSACLNFKEIGFGPDTPGGMGEYLICGETNLHKIPDDWSYVEGAWVEPFSIGYFSIWGNGGYIDASDTALIYGCGPIGLSSLITAKTSGAITIMADPIGSRREIAKKFGADYALDPSSATFASDVANICEGGGPSVICECSGNDSAVAAVFQIAGHNCRVSFTGHTAGRNIPVEIGQINWRTLRIKGSGGTDHFTPRTIRFMSQIRDKYDFKDLTTHYFNFEDIHKAFDVAMHSKQEAIKVMLLFGEEN
jgi:threonine dehydrogenase-like Zn-dependent dehydrogenase